MNCEGCASDGKTTRVLVRKNEATGTLTAPCDECDATEYAQAGTAKHARWEKKIEKLAVAAPGAPADPAKPAPASSITKRGYGDYAK